MKDENNANEIWFENASQNFEEAVTLGDWPTVRAILADIEDKGFPTAGLRRHMNLEMAKEDVCPHGVDLMTDTCEPCKEQSKIDERSNEDNGV